MADPFSGILEAYYKGELARQGAEMDFLKLQESQRQARENEQFRRDSLAREDARLAEQQRANRVSENNARENLILNQNQDARLQAENERAEAEALQKKAVFDRQNKNALLVEASQDLKQLVGTSGTLEKAFQNGDISLDDIDFFMKRYGGVLGILDGPDGSQRVYRGAMNVLGPDGQPSGSFTMQVYDPATMLQGPLTTGGGSGPDERVITFTQSDLVPLLRQVDRIARRMRGDGSRADLQLVSSAMNSLNGATSTASSSRLAAGAFDAQAPASGATAGSASTGVGTENRIPQLEGTMPDDALTDSMIRQQQAGLAMLDSGLNYRGTPVDADTLGALASLSRPSQSFRSDGTAYEAPGTLSAEQFGNLASGDDPRGTNLTLAGQVATAGGALAQDANARLTSRANNQQTTNATIAKSNQVQAQKEADASAKAAQDALVAEKNLVDEWDEAGRVAAVAAGIGEDGSKIVGAQFRQAASSSAVKDPKITKLFAGGSITAQNIAKPFANMARAINEFNSGSRSIPGDNFAERVITDNFVLQTGRALLWGNYLKPQDTLHLSILSEVTGINPKRLLVNVIDNAVNASSAGQAVSPRRLKVATIVASGPEYKESGAVVREQELVRILSMPRDNFEKLAKKILNEEST